jgi:hypothetical protein
VGKQAAAFGDVEKLTQLGRQLPDLANTPDANVSFKRLGCGACPASRELPLPSPPVVMFSVY